MVRVREYGAEMARRILKRQPSANSSPTQAETNSIVFAQSQGKFLIELQTKEIMTEFEVGGIRTADGLV